MPVFQVAVYGDLFMSIYQFDNESRANNFIEFLNQGLGSDLTTEWDEVLQDMSHYTWKAFMLQNDTSVFQQFKDSWQEYWMDWMNCSIEEFQEVWDENMGIGQDREYLGLGLEVLLRDLNDEKCECECEHILLQETDFAVGLLEEVQAVG